MAGDRRAWSADCPFVDSDPHPHCFDHVTDLHRNTLLGVRAYRQSHRAITCLSDNAVRLAGLQSYTMQNARLVGKLLDWVVSRDYFYILRCPLVMYAQAMRVEMARKTGEQRRAKLKESIEREQEDADEKREARLGKIQDRIRKHVCTLPARYQYGTRLYTHTSLHLTLCYRLLTL